MKKHLPFIGIILVAISCVSDGRTADFEIDPLYTPFDLMAPQCTEAKMTLWFELFHKYQDEGFDMYQSDEKARKQVEIELSACDRSQPSPHVEKKSARR